MTTELELIERLVGLNQTQQAEIDLLIKARKDDNESLGAIAESALRFIRIVDGLTDDLAGLAVSHSKHREDTASEIAALRRLINARPLEAV